MQDDVSQRIGGEIDENQIWASPGPLYSDHTSGGYTQIFYVWPVLKTFTTHISDILTAFFLHILKYIKLS